MLLFVTIFDVVADDENSVYMSQFSSNSIRPKDNSELNEVFCYYNNSSITIHFENSEGKANMFIKNNTQNQTWVYSFFTTFDFTTVVNFNIGEQYEIIIETAKGNNYSTIFYLN